MAKQLNLDSTKGKIKDINGNIDSKAAESEKLEKAKIKSIESQNTIETSNMDEATQKTVLEALASEREQMAKDAEKLSKELDSDSKMLEEIGQELDDGIKDTETEKSKLEGLKSALDPMGLGAGVEKGINKMEGSLTDMQTIRQSIADSSKKLREVQAKLGTI